MSRFVDARHGEHLASAERSIRAALGDGGEVALPGARVERVDHRMDGAHVCAYHVYPPPTHGARGKRGPGKE